VRLGLFLPTLEGLLGDRGLPRWRELRRLARRAEAIGFDALLVPDHLVFRESPYWGIPAGEERGVWEAWMVLAALAEATERARLGLFVGCTGFRNPALLAKMAATVDEVGEGRVILGLGCGTHAPEYRAFGYPFDHRVSRFEEALAIVAPLLREGRADFTGRYHQARDAVLAPPGPRPGGPPVWVAAFQPRMLGLAARWADAVVTAWHPGPEAVTAALAPLPAACREAGRDPGTLGRVAGAIVALDPLPPGPLPRSTIRGTPAEVTARLAAFGDAGVGDLVLMLAPRGVDGLERVEPVLAALRRLPS
jgi:alkanesulfonate monooxygenase SsuD/methylene tetrahydromethanopterin reductase-like flavin-dependent oxidoreductase (luciferase family)